MTQLPTGWIPDAPNPFDARFAESRIAARKPTTLSASIDYRHLDEPRIQLFNSCVGHAIAGAAALCMAIAGKPIAFPSALFPYTGARILAQPPRGLQDLGSSPRLAMTWLRDRGMIAEERWPETRENLNAVPPMDAWQEGDAATVESFYRISDGNGASDGVRAALMRGYCPIFAMQVDSKYERTGRQIYDGPGGAIIGGHMQCVVGYLDLLDVFVVRNTWGPGFGDDSYAYVAASVIDTMARDVWVISAAPEVF